MFWIISLAMTAIVAWVVLAPVWRGRTDSQPAAAYDLRVYRDQLREVDRDLERGVIQPDDAQRLRAEIGRKVLDADRRLAEARPSGAQGGGVVATVLLVVLLAGGFLLYLREGVPGAPDMPIAERLAAAEAAYRNRPSQAEAEAAAAPRPPMDLSEADPAWLELVDQLRAAVAQNPDDPRGLSLLVTNEMRLGNIAAAREAAERLIAVQGDRPDPTDLMRLAALMIEAAGGLITPEAEQLLVRALRIDPTQPQARYLLGVMQIQNGRPDRAFPLWRRLLEEGPESASWIPPIRATIEDLAWLAGIVDYVPPAPVASSLPGPDAAGIEDAMSLPEADRQTMIEDMVAGLQSRLATEGGTPEEWARLIQSLSVLGRAADARAIWDEAQVRFAGSETALAPIAEAARQAGLVQ
ncbi:c-type cytochrome biogenesis protein CcmI [Paracoccus bogoriensis]|uniref:c-type cytochrome biogenesis protein CcmI n=1 Tax=Paracoccus bogoriensis TaxID=242065 RepID=UPI001CA4A2BE|nr:c-type cytochrome biogenesis protein CcmI [Paracoccus bogoriensis]MBW7056005.1 c-type cytochrome biogenesis protein CcmI [Paracoccus bogoriensis]